MDWAKAVIHPLGLAGYALALVFGASLKIRNLPPWWPKAAIGLAALCVIGGLTLAGLENSPRHDDALALQLTKVIQDQQASLRQKDDKIDELTRRLQAEGVKSVVEISREPGNVAGQAAVTGLERGDTQPSAALLLERAATTAAAGRKEAARLAREAGALLAGNDLAGARAAYQKAAEYDPDHTWTWFLLGDVERDLGSLFAALDHYRKGEAAAQRRQAADPKDADAERDRSVSHTKIGDMLAARGDGGGALDSYRKGLAIAEALAKRTPKAPSPPRRENGVRVHFPTPRRLGGPHAPA
jgi:tetratricopeptide (TPR) repeat protein